MWSDTNSRDREPQLEIRDIQGDILVGLQKDFEWFIFFRITDPDKFKAFARASLVHRITSTAEALVSELNLAEHKAQAGAKDRKLLIKGLNLALTRAGLERLGVPGIDKLGDEAFKEGLTPERSKNKLNDPSSGKYSTGSWKFGQHAEGSDCPYGTIDGVVILTAPDQDTVDRLLKQLANDADTNGWSVIYKERCNTRPNHRNREHFGFRDGISQPAVRGQIDPSLSLGNFLAPDKTDLVWPGEFVFGYEGGADEEMATAPDGPGPMKSGGPPWTRNGSLMVIRRLKQFVPEFNSFVAKQNATIDPELLAARIVGRWPSGAPLVKTPGQDDHALAKDPKPNNDFDYHTDAQGRRCPVGAHIRKAYPRTVATTFRNRLIRRGIAFGPEVTDGETERGKTDEDKDGFNGRGLMFVSYQTSIERQFEGLTKELNSLPHCDALIGRPRTDSPENPEDKDRCLSQLTIPYPAGKTANQLTVGDFVSPTGGGYFFMPSISAFKMMVAETPAETSDDKSGYLAFRIGERLKAKTDAHSKTSGSGMEMRSAGNLLLLFDQNDVHDVFSRLLDLFNAGDYDDMLPFLDPNITWKMIHHVDTISGAAKVVRWLTDRQLSRNRVSHCLPGKPLPALPKKNPSRDGSVVISSSAKWTTITNSKESTEDIEYFFTFIRLENGWVLNNVFAIPS